MTDDENVIFCGPKPPTDEDRRIVREFAEFLRAKKTEEGSDEVHDPPASG